MLTRWFPGLSLVCLAAALAPAPPAAAAKADPVVVARVRSLDALVENFRYLASLAGAEEQAKQAQRLFESRVGPKGLQGIDPKRPFGVYATDVNATSPVFMLPIKDEEDFLGLLKNVNLEAKKDRDGLYTVKLDFLPVEVEAYFRFANRYAYVTALNVGAVDKDKLADPALLKPETPATLASVTLHIDRISGAIRQLAVHQSERRFQQLEEKAPPRETAGQKQFRVQVLRDLSETVAAVIQDGGQVNFRVEVDRTAHRLAAELSLTGRSGSGLARAIARLGEEPSLFAGLMKGDAAGNGLVHVILPENLRKSLVDMADQGMKKALERESDQTKRDLAERFFKALRPTLQAGELDFGATLRGPVKGGRYATVVGLKLRNGTEVEKVVRDAINKTAPEAEKGRIKFDAEKAGDVSIHRIELKDGADEKFRKTFGDGPVYFAFRKDAALLAVGEGALEAIKEAVAARAQEGPPVRLEAALARLVPLMKQGRNPGAAKVAEETFADAKDGGKISFRVEGGKALKARLSLSALVVKLISRGYRESRRQAEQDQE